MDQWYEEGARGLVAVQRDDGRWGSRFRRTPGDQRNVYETSFSLLFLSRATSYAVPGGK